MTFEEFGTLLSQICSRSSLAADRPLVWTVITNPHAGGFAIRSRRKKHFAQLKERAEAAKKKPERSGWASITSGGGKDKNHSGLILTSHSGHAGEITSALIKEAEAIAPQNGVRPFFLIITAGGDGTSRDTMHSLYLAPQILFEDFAVLRLPMGTGNDASDAEELDKALDLLIEPSTLAKQRVLQLKTESGKGPFCAFNILSVGGDAFVTHMTNKTKGKMPGDSYKIWVDLAALFYDIIYKVGYMTINAFDEEGREVKALNEKTLLLAVGESGRRTYGSRKLIFPDERNMCAVKQMPLTRKLVFKKLLPLGAHITMSESILWSAHSVRFSTENPILAQMDGETVRLEKADFPATIELTKPLIQILKKRV